jgi:mannose-6-phosphate isomerase-like protein (cupin superfamily)
MPIIQAPDDATHDLGGARFTSLATPSSGSAETSVWQVELDAGAPAAPHSLTREEVFVVLDGAAQVVIDGVHGIAEQGDAVVVPAEVLFELAAFGSAPVRLLCCLPVGGQARIGDETFTPPWAE